MLTIDYPRHFLLLIPAAALLWLLSDRATSLAGAGDARVFLVFGAMGALHAAALVMSMRDRGIRLGKVLLFVALVTCASVLTGVLPLVTPLLRFAASRSMVFFVFLILVLPSAFGATCYWLLVRVFWLGHLSYLGLMTTVVFCCVATAGSGFVGQLLPEFLADLVDLVPTLTWWVAFSLSLYCGEMRWDLSRRVATARY